MSDDYNDFIVFTDDRDQTRRLYVKILDISQSWVQIELKSGRILTLNPNRVLKIKQEGGIE